jgi:hypothetical protein
MWKNRAFDCEVFRCDKVYYSNSILTPFQHSWYHLKTIYQRQRHSWVTTSHTTSRDIFNIVWHGIYTPKDQWEHDSRDASAFLCVTRRWCLHKISIRHLSPRTGHFLSPWPKPRQEALSLTSLSIYQSIYQECYMMYKRGPPWGLDLWVHGTKLPSGDQPMINIWKLHYLVWAAVAQSVERLTTGWMTESEFESRLFQEFSLIHIDKIDSGAHGFSYGMDSGSKVAREWSWPTTSI